MSYTTRGSVRGKDKIVIDVNENKFGWVYCDITHIAKYRKIVWYPELADAQAQATGDLIHEPASVDCYEYKSLGSKEIVRRATIDELAKAQGHDRPGRVHDGYTPPAWVVAEGEYEVTEHGYLAERDDLGHIEPCCGRRLKRGHSCIIDSNGRCQATYT